MSSTTTTLHEPISATQVLVVALCALVTLIEGIDLTLIPLLAPRITEAWSVPAAEFGIILSSGPIGLVMGGLGVGYLADRIGRRNALIAAMLLIVGMIVAYQVRRVRVLSRYFEQRGTPRSTKHD